MSFTSTVEEVNSTRRKFHISVEPKVVSEAFNSAVGEVMQTANVRGFRKGKVPPALVKKFFGEDVRKKAFESVVNKSYQNAIGQTDLQIVSYPHIENDGKFEEGAPFKFTATVDINPMIDVKGYKELTLKKVGKDVDDAAVEAELQKLGKAIATFEKVTEARPVQKEDIAVVSYDATVDGKPYAPASVKGQRLDVSAGRLLPEFEKAVLGAKVGETRKFTVNYPETHEQKDLAGKTAEFTLTVDSLEKAIVPPFDDAFAQRFGTQNIADMKKSVRELLDRTVEQERMQNYQEQIVEQLLAKNEFEVPESLVENTVDRAIEMANQENPGKKLDSNNEEVRKQYRDWARSQVKGVLVLGHVARAESIAVEDKELTPELMSLARSYRMDVQQLIKQGGQQMIEEVRGRVLLGKTVKHLSTFAKIEG